MILGIDYDNTFTRDPRFWEEFVALAKTHGHECVMVTGRQGGEMEAEVLRNIGNLMPVVFAGANWKRAAAEKRGWKIDVWIDDSPEYVSEQSLIGRAALGTFKLK